MSDTEKDSLYQDLHTKTSLQLITEINQEDQKVALAVKAQLQAIEQLIEALVPRMEKGGRLFYVGAGTSGRLGVVDASECPPTYGVPHGMVVGLIAGGDSAIRKAVEFAEDDFEQGFKDLEAYHINETDMVVGIAASGRTPYVIGALRTCQEKGIATGCIVCSKGSQIANVSDYPVEVNVGPEYVTGSTRMKSGTAQKLALNMITTASMIRLGRVHGNKMIDMQLSNDKLVDRGTKMVMKSTGLDYDEAQKVLLEKGSVRLAIDSQK
jgi:N-acetylmuramic acid 6-phosphate etherase